MTKIINAYADGSGSIADSLKSLGESMFGNEARDSLIREGVYTKQRQNSAAEAVAAARRAGNEREANVQALRYDPTFNPGPQNLGFQGTVPGMTADNPAMQVRQVAAGHPYSATAGGERENIAQRDRSADQATARAAATQ